MHLCMAIFLKKLIMLEDNIVIVLDNSNYIFSEKVPFKAKVLYKYSNEIWVTSLVTGNEYELYYHQVLESLNIEEITKLLDLSKYEQA